VDLIATDPAYSGMNRHLLLGRGRIVGDYRKAGAEGQKWFSEFQDDPETFRYLLAEFHRVLRNQRHLYVMFDSYSLLSLGHLVREKFDVKNLIVWDKMLLGMGHHFRRRHELVLFASKGKRPLARRDLPDVWRIRRIARAPYPTQKPVEVFEAMLCASVQPGYTVCDPFAGSGSAAIAALRHGCHFIGADISPRACRLATERIARFSVDGRDPLQPDAAADHHQPPFWRGPLSPSRRPRAASTSRTSAAPIRAQTAR
jgi:site-specific DNA-methyltransferase (adenine-specific)